MSAFRDTENKLSISSLPQSQFTAHWSSFSLVLFSTNNHKNDIQEEGEF